MSWQRLSPRNTRRLERVTGLPLWGVYSHGDYIHEFVTAGHLHGVYCLKTGTWAVSATPPPSHFSSCPKGSVPPLNPAETSALTGSGFSYEEAWQRVYADEQEWVSAYLGAQALKEFAVPVKKTRKRKPSLAPGSTPENPR